MEIKKKVDELIRKFQTRNPFEIIQGLNVILVFVPLIDTRAFYQYLQRNNIIYIDENLSHAEKVFECAHEMGHMFRKILRCWQLKTLTLKAHMLLLRVTRLENEIRRIKQRIEEIA